MTRDLWLVRVYFFLLIGGVGFAQPFVNLFYRQQGLTGTEIGLVLTAGSIIGLLASPWWGRWSDAGAPLTRLLQLGLVAAGITLIVLSQQSTFGWIVLIVGLESLAVAGLSPLSDALALRITAARRAGYGSVRVWGSAGWAVCVLVSGWLIERTSLVAGFLGNAFGFFVAALLLLGIPKIYDTPRERTQLRGLREAVRQVIQNRALLVLALALLAQGLLGNGHMEFGNIYLEQLGASAALIGIASMLAAAVELPAMFLADRLVARIGATYTLLLGFLLTGAPLILVLIFPEVWAILVTRATFGVAFSLFVIALVKYVTHYAPPALTATMLALFTVTLMALIQMVAAPLGGIIFDAVGAYWLYALAVVGNLLACAILFFGAPRKTIDTRAV